MGNFKNNRGSALVAVISITGAIFLLAVAGVVIASNQSLRYRRAVKMEDALLYAEAGFYSYLYYLNQDAKFYETSESASMENTDIAFQDGYYSLEVTPPSMANPVVTVRSTGWLKDDPGIVAGIEVEIHKRQFVQYGYASNTEDDNIWWVTGDVVDGPLHTNHILRMMGSPIFLDEVTYSVGLQHHSSGATPDYRAGPPRQVPPLVFPPTNNSLREWSQRPGGYYYEGRTAIMLNSDGTVTIRNGDDPAETLPLPSNGVIFVDGVGTGKWSPDAGNVFISGTLRGRLTVAADNDIYVTAWDPTNWEAPVLNDPTEPLGGATPQGVFTGGITYSNTDVTSDNPTNDILGLVAHRHVQVLQTGWLATSAEGNFHSSTFSANVWKVEGGAWRWRNETFERFNVAPENITIYGAVFTMNESFTFENYDLGWWWGMHSSHPAWMPNGNQRGAITLVGSLIQDRRGPVGVSSGGQPRAGYLKDYSYDRRMSYDLPPRFLEPENAGWGIVSWREFRPEN